MIKLPKMIFFDYGQTLVNENFDPLKGNAALLSYAIENKHGYTAEDATQKAKEINDIICSIGNIDSGKRACFEIETPSSMFNRYLFESLDIKLSISYEECERIFWFASSDGKPTDGIADFLKYLKESGIRTGVISNIAYSENLVTERINSFLPNNDFELIITSSSYMFRKPNKAIFDIALIKAGLSPCDVWYIGDRYEFDAAGALNAGIFPILYTGAADT